MYVIGRVPIYDPPKLFKKKKKRKEKQAKVYASIKKVRVSPSQVLNAKLVRGAGWSIKDVLRLPSSKFLSN